MAYEIPGFSWTMLAAADLRTSQFCFINADTTAAGSRAALPAAGGRAIGVLQNKPNTGETATIVQTGISKVKVGAGGVTAGDNVKVTTAGAVIPANAASYAVGIALASGAVNEIVPVLLTPSGGGGLLA